MSKSKLELKVSLLLRSKGIKFKREVLYIKGRRFKLDFEIIAKEKIGIEINGGQFMKKSGHNSASGLSRDYEKNNLGIINGWKVLQYGTEIVNKNPYKIIEDLKQLGVN